MIAILRIAFVAVLLIASERAQSQNFPSQPVRIVVPFPAGGGTDILMRLIQDKYAALLGQPVVIDNRPGASGNIGTGIVAKSKPDGHTLIVTGTIIGAYPRLFSSLSYDPINDFSYVGILAESPAVIVVNSQSPFKTFDDLMSEAKRRPLNFASAGLATPQHLATERLSRLNKAQMTHVPYKGSATAVSDLLAGVLDFGALSLSSTLSLIQEGKLRPLAVASANRSKLLPNVPSIMEAGYGDVSGTVGFFLAAPANTPIPAVEKLSSDLKTIIGNADVQQEFAKRGYETVIVEPKDVLAKVRDQQALWEPIIDELKLKFD